MPSIDCPKCGTRSWEIVESCPRCSTPFTTGKPWDRPAAMEPSGCMKAVITVGAVIGVLGVIWGCAEAYFNLRGISLLAAQMQKMGVHLTADDHRHGAITSLIQAGLALLLLAACVGMMKSKRWSRKLYLVVCGVFVTYTLVIHVWGLVARPNIAGMIVMDLLLTLPYPILGLAFIGRRDADHFFDPPPPVAPIHRD